MNPKILLIIAVIVAIAGVYFAGLGMGMNDRPGREGSGNVYALIGSLTAVLGIGGLIYSTLQIRKMKGK